jgi:dipeptide/tripeptide permease
MDKACFEERNEIKLSQPNYPMNFNLATILAGLAILFVLITYMTTAPLVPVAVILLGLAIILGGRGTNLRP